MKGNCNPATTLFLLLVAVSPLAFSHPTYSQNTRQLSAVERRVQTMSRQALEYEREEMERERNGKSKLIRNTKAAKLIRAEIEDDLKGLQNLYNSIVTELKLKNDISDAFAKETAASIKKRASRLKGNLALPASDSKEETIPATAPKGTRKSLSALCKHIYEFITNPIFETKGGLNVDHSTKAGQSLDMIIWFAEKIANLE